jgi:hypothetical protein
MRYFLSFCLLLAFAVSSNAAFAECKTPPCCKDLGGGAQWFGSVEQGMCCKPANASGVWAVVYPMNLTNGATCCGGGTMIVTAAGSRCCKDPKSACCLKPNGACCKAPNSIECCREKGWFWNGKECKQSPK